MSFIWVTLCMFECEGLCVLPYSRNEWIYLKCTFKMRQSRSFPLSHTAHHGCFYYVTVTLLLCRRPIPTTSALSAAITWLGYKGVHSGWRGCQDEPCIDIAVIQMIDICFPLGELDGFYDLVYNKLKTVCLKQLLRIFTKSISFWWAVYTDVVLTFIVLG